MKTAMQELIEMLPPYFFAEEEIKMFLEKEKEQIIKVSMDTTAECWISLGVEMGINEDEILNDSEIKKHRKEAEQYYNETFKN